MHPIVPRRCKYIYDSPQQRQLTPAEFCSSLSLPTTFWRGFFAGAHPRLDRAGWRRRCTRAAPCGTAGARARPRGRCRRRVLRNLQGLSPALSASWRLASRQEVCLLVIPSGTWSSTCCLPESSAGLPPPPPWGPSPAAVSLRSATTPGKYMLPKYRRDGA